MTINQSLSVVFVGMYNQRKEKGETYIPDFTVAKMTMTGLYNSFVRDGVLKPIEEISKEEKEKLVSECREVKNHNYTNETLTQTSKVLYLIKSINDYS